MYNAALYDVVVVGDINESEILYSLWEKKNSDNKLIIKKG